MSRHGRNTVGIFGLVALGLALSGPASAGDDHAWGSDLSLRLGAVAMVTPTYEGSSEYRVIAVPYIAPAFALSGGRVQVNGPDDVRLRLFQHGGFEAGPVAGWRFGREEDDGRRLHGLGDVDGGLVVGGYMAWQMGILKPFVSYHHQVTGDDGGGLLRFGTQAIWNPMDRVEMTGTLGASYADDNYMDAYFSVTPIQAAASSAGLAAYEADAGIKDVYLGLAAKIALTDAWTLNLSGRYSRLVGDAGDSPVVEDENQFSGAIGASYKFNLR